MKGKAGEPFVMIPRRLFKAVRVGDLSSDALAVLVSLLAAADDGLEVIGTLRGLMDSFGWSKSHDQITRHLAALREGGWIDYTSPRGKNKPYLIRITGGATLTYAPTEAPTDAREASVMRRSTDADASVQVTANLHGEGEEATRNRRKRVDGAPPRREEKEEREEQRAGTPAREEPAQLTEGEVQNLVSTLQANGWWAGQIEEAKSNPALAYAWFEYAEKSGSDFVSRDALKGFKTGQLPPAPAHSDLAEILTSWIRNVGWQVPDWSTCEAEIADAERRHGRQLTVEENQTLFELWDELRVPVEVDA